MAFDRHMNLVLGDSEEYRKVPPKKGKSDEEVSAFVYAAMAYDVRCTRLTVTSCCRGRRGECWGWFYCAARRCFR